MNVRRLSASMLIGALLASLGTMSSTALPALAQLSGGGSCSKAGESPIVKGTFAPQKAGVTPYVLFFPKTLNNERYLAFLDLAAHPSYLAQVARNQPTQLGQLEASVYANMKSMLTNTYATQMNSDGSFSCSDLGIGSYYVLTIGAQKNGAAKSSSSSVAAPYYWSTVNVPVAIPPKKSSSTLGSVVGTVGTVVGVVTGGITGVAEAALSAEIQSAEAKVVNDIIYYSPKPFRPISEFDPNA